MKKQFYAVIIILAGLMIDVVLARMAIDFQISFATTESEKTNAYLIAIAMTSCNFVLLGSAVYLFEQRKIKYSAIAFSLAFFVLLYEFHGAIGGWSNVNAHFEQNSEYAKTENAKIETAKAKAELLKTSKVDIAEVQKKISKINGSMLAKEHKAANCPALWIKSCKTPALRGIEEQQSELKRLESLVENQNKQAKALDELSLVLNKTSGTDSDNAKAHEAFKTVSRYICTFEFAACSGIERAKQYQSVFLVSAGGLMVILGQFLLMIGFILLDAELHLMRDFNSPAPSQMKFANTDGITSQNKITTPAPPQVFERGKSESLIENKFGFLKELYKKVQKKPIGFTTEGTDTVITVDLKKQSDEAPAVKEFNQFVSGLTSVPEKKKPTQIDREAIAKQVDYDGRGEDALLEYKIIKPMILDGSFFKVEKKVGTLSVQRVIKSISETGSSIGTNKAAKIVELAVSDRLPMSKEEHQKNLLK
jgi:hypothetical protein